MGRLAVVSDVVPGAIGGNFLAPARLVVCDVRLRHSQHSDSGGVSESRVETGFVQINSSQPLKSVVCNSAQSAILFSVRLLLSAPTVKAPNTLIPPMV